MVYDQPDFDANVIAKIRRGVGVRVSSGTAGSYAKFHRVRVGNKLGWIADIDVRVEGQSRQAPVPFGQDDTPGAKKKKKKGKKADEPPAKKPFEDMPLLFNKYVGVVFGGSDFIESVNGVDSSTMWAVYGLKITGPDVLLHGPIMDFNLLLHYGAPAYYNSLSTTKPGGFVIMTDALLLYPFFNRDRTLITLGLGPMLQFSNFQVTNGGSPMSLTELDAGLSTQLSFGFKLGRVALRLEAKYELEKHSEKMLQLAVQQQF